MKYVSRKENERVDWMVSRLLLGCVMYTCKLWWLLEQVRKRIDGRALSRAGEWKLHRTAFMNGKVGRMGYGRRENKRIEKSLNWWWPIYLRIRENWMVLHTEIPELTFLLSYYVNLKLYLFTYLIEQKVFSFLLPFFFSFFGSKGESVMSRKRWKCQLEQEITDWISSHRN